MKVLVVTQYFWPEPFPINLLISALKKTGCEITVFTGQPNYPEGKILDGYSSFSFKKEMYNNCKIVRVPLIGRGKSGSVRLFVNYFSFLVSGILFGPWVLRRQKFDIIIGVAQSPILAVIPAIFLKRIKKIPLVTWVGDLWPESLQSTGHIRNAFIIKCIGKMAAWIYRKNDLILVQSATFEQPVHTLCDSVNIEYLPNPAEAVSLEEIENYTPALLLQKGFNVVYAGNIGKVQSLEMIVEAAFLLKEHKDIHFVLVGNGSQLEWLKQTIEKKNISNIQLPGRYAPADIPGILIQSDALLVSLIRDKTMSLTVPSKTQYYMSMGKPIIASLDGEGARVVTESGGGVATPAEDAEALAKAILFLRDAGSEFRKNMGKKSLQYFNTHFESDTVSKKLVFLLENVIIRQSSK